MIYLNHAGTSWPKPVPVQDAVRRAMMSDPLDWNAEFDHHQKVICDEFHIENPEQLLLTPGCTSAISTAIEDQPWKAGDRALTSHFEHHALRRPLEKLSRQGITLEAIGPAPDSLVDVDQLRTELQTGDVRLVAMTAACNVTGELLPIQEVVKLCRSYSVTTLVDAAQIVGWCDLDVPALGADLVAFGAHKGMQAPWGIGGLYIAAEAKLDCLSATCELPQRENVSRPSYCDVGSVDRIALAGWAAAIEWLQDPEQTNRLQNGRKQIDRVTDVIRKIEGVIIHGTDILERKLPTIAFQLENCPSTKLAAKLAERSVVVGSGLQCAPMAHRALGTDKTGVMRLSVGPTTTDEDVEAAINILVDVLSEETRSIK